MRKTDSIRRALDISEAYLRTNARTILTSSAVTGVVTTAYFTARASFRAARKIETAEPKPETVSDKIRLVWVDYIPAAILGGTTIAAIVMNHKMSSRKIAAISAAYALTEKALDEYKDKLAEAVSKKDLEAFRNVLAEEKIEDNPPNEANTSKSPSVVFSDAKVLCCELYTMRYFYCDIETLRRAENHVNAQLVAGDRYVFMSDFYHEIGLENTSFSHDFGWIDSKPLKIHFTTAMTPDGRPCLAFEYNYVHNIENGVCP